MRRISLFSLFAFLVAAVATAQNNRSAVAVSGNDLNPCTVASPCRSFAVALAHTVAGGEVIALEYRNKREWNHGKCRRKLDRGHLRFDHDRYRKRSGRDHCTARKCCRAAGRSLCDQGTFH